jgi:hypothetical protein
VTKQCEGQGQPDPLPTQKKAYNTPRLEVYGDLRTITRAVGTHGNFDPPPHPTGANRTQP